MRVVARKHDVIPITVTDPLEEDFPELGLVTLEDFETGEEVVFDTSGPEGKAWAAHVRRAKQARENLFRKLKVDFVNVRTDQPYLGALVDFFRARQRRLRRG